MFLFWKNSRPDNLLLKLTDLYRSSFMALTSSKELTVLMYIRVSADLTAHYLNFLQQSWWICPPESTNSHQKHHIWKVWNWPFSILPSRSKQRINARELCLQVSKWCLCFILQLIPGNKIQKFALCTLIEIH